MSAMPTRSSYIDSISDTNQNAQVKGGFQNISEAALPFVQRNALF